MRKLSRHILLRTWLWWRERRRLDPVERFFIRLIIISSIALVALIVVVFWREYL